MKLLPDYPPENERALKLMCIETKDLAPPLLELYLMPSIFNTKKARSSRESELLGIILALKADAKRCERMSRRVGWQSGANSCNKAMVL